MRIATVRRIAIAPRYVEPLDEAAYLARLQRATIALLDAMERRQKRLTSQSAFDARDMPVDERKRARF